MKKPDRPSNEAERLVALRSYDILDTEPEASFDALTRLAAGILDVPIALVSLVDVDRQWFKSRYGIDAPETSRDVSFCGHVVAEDASLVVSDALEDPRFADNPLTTGGPRVRFYAGAPLRTPDGFVLGSLCGIDHVPRKPTSKQLELLALLADQVVNQLEARRRRHQIEAEREVARETAGRLRTLFEAMSEGVVVQDRTGVITKVNSAAERILGLTLDQMLGRTSVDPTWRSVHEDGTPFPGEDHPAMVTLRTGQPSLNVIMGVHKPDGGLTWISINALPIRTETEEAAHAVLTTFHDVTAIRAARLAADRLARQEHLITTGTLAAGVGHEINNPLTYILANIEFAMEELRSIAGGSPSGRLQELVGVLGEAREGADRVQKIVRGLRALAREESVPIPSDVEPVVDISINMAAHELRHKARVTKHMGANVPVLADESRLTQVLVNLLVNAAQAFRTEDSEKNHVSVTSAREKDGRVSISVTDNGPGISPAVLPRIFDPFFTTKPVGVGTGLGLSICRSIVGALDGDIVVESVVGRGTTIRVRLPAATQALGAERADRAANVAVRGRVLAVDDEPAILSALKRILGRDHEVVTEEDPREALARLERGEEFDVIFCDLTMPHLGGDALYGRVRETNPALADRFVFITGGATEQRAKNFLAEVPNERVEKPFNVQNMRGIVRRFVDARARTPA